MGHRAIVAYERTNGSYSLHYSHRGAYAFQLREQLRQSQPFGDGSDSSWARNWIEEIRSTQIDGPSLDDTPPAPSFAVNPEPMGTAETVAEICEHHLNFLHYEALYVVAIDWSVRTYLPLWFGMQYDCSLIIAAPQTGNGALVHIGDEVPTAVDHTNLVAKWTAAKDVLGDMLEKEHVSIEMIAPYLQDKLAAWTPPGTEIHYTDTLTIGGPR